MGALLDEPDAYVRDKLAAAFGNAEELAELQAKTEAILKDAHTEAPAKIREARVANQVDIGRQGRGRQEGAMPGRAR